jgi:hypothetical protein
VGAAIEPPVSHANNKSRFNSKAKHQFNNPQPKSSQPQSPKKPLADFFKDNILRDLKNSQDITALEGAGVSFLPQFARRHSRVTANLGASMQADKFAEAWVEKAAKRLRRSLSVSEEQEFRDTVQDLAFNHFTGKPPAGGNTS